MHTQNHGAIAQLVEQRTENPCVPGSIPGGTTKKTASAVFFYSNWLNLSAMIALNASFISSGKKERSINSNHLSFAFANLAMMFLSTLPGKMLYRESDLRAALEKNYVAPFAHRNAEDFPAVYGRR